MAKENGTEQAEPRTDEPQQDSLLNKAKDLLDTREQEESARRVAEALGLDDEGRASRRELMDALSLELLSAQNLDEAVGLEDTEAYREEGINFDTLREGTPMLLTHIEWAESVAYGRIAVGYGVALEDAPARTIRRYYTTSEYIGDRLDALMREGRAQNGARPVIVQFQAIKTANGNTVHKLVATTPENKRALLAALRS